MDSIMEVIFALNVLLKTECGPHLQHCTLSRFVFIVYYAFCKLDRGNVY